MRCHPAISPLRNNHCSPSSDTKLDPTYIFINLAHIKFSDLATMKC